MHLPGSPAFYAHEPFDDAFVLLAALLGRPGIVWFVGKGRQNKVLFCEPVWTFSKPSLSDLSL